MPARRFSPWVACLTLAVAAPFAAAQFGGWKPPKIDIKPPKIDIKPPKIDVKPPDLSSLDPVEAARRELKKAQQSAMKELRKLDPDGIFREVKKSVAEFKAGAEAKSGLKFDEKTGDVDLRGHRAGKTLHSWMDKFAQGNEGKGEVEEFRFNVKSRVLTLRLYVRHKQRQNWGALGKVDLYSCTQTARLSYDFPRQDADFDINLGPLAPKINTRMAKALKDGDLLAAAEAAAPDGVGKVIKYERKNDYDKVLKELKAKHGEQHVYLSSRRFVEWAGSKSIGKYAATAVGSGGAAVWPQIMKDAREIAAKEMPDVAAWLERLGQKDARRIAEKLLTGRKPDWPFLKFEMVSVPHYAREVAGVGKVSTPWRQFNNLGFVIVFEPRFASR